MTQEYCVIICLNFKGVQELKKFPVVLMNRKKKKKERDYFICITCLTK